MKKKFMLLCFSILAIILCACGNSVSKEEYDSLKAKYDDVSERHRELFEENAQLRAQLSEYENQTTEQIVQNDVTEEIEITTEETEMPKEEIEYRTDLTYDEISRRPDDYVGEYLEFSGKVIQLIESSDGVELRIATAQNGYDDVFYVAYDASISEERILEDDKVVFRGQYAGIMQYESTLGGTISVPSMWVLEIERQ